MDGMDPDIRIRTPRLELRLLRPEDRDEFIRVHAVSAEHLRPWTPRRPEGQTLPEFFRQQVQRSQQAAREGTGCRMVAVLRGRVDAIAPPSMAAASEQAATMSPAVPAHGRIAGFFGVNNIVRGVFQNADAGWSVSADCVGMGLATEGVAALLDLAFAPPERGGLGLHRVQANVIPANAASVRVAEKCGFRREGMSLRMLQIDGRWQDHINFAKLADEHEAPWLGARPV